MESQAIDGLALFFDPDERETAELVAAACKRTIDQVQQHWGLFPPPNCRVYVMTSWRRFFLQSASWPRRIWLIATFPLWSIQARRVWPYAGGWNMPYRSGPVVGVKPARLILEAQTPAGARLFVQHPPEIKVQHITCHELTHAFTSHLHLPAWLNEGLAMVTVDRYAQAPTIREETIHLLAASSGEDGTRSYRELQKSNPEALLYPVVRGYWLTRYIEESRPGLLKELLAQRQDQRVLEAQVASHLGLPVETFWRQIDDLLIHWHLRRR